MRIYTPAGRKPPIFLVDGQRQAPTVWDQGRPGKFDLVYQGQAAWTSFLGRSSIVSSANLLRRIEGAAVAVASVIEANPPGQNGPAGPSSRAAYQTCRACTSFGRTAWRQPDTGRPPGLCTLARSAGIYLRIRARQGTRRTEADIVVTVRRHVPVTVGRADVRRLIVERAATQHTATRSSPSES